MYYWQTPEEKLVTMTTHCNELNINFSLGFFNEKTFQIYQEKIFYYSIPQCFTFRVVGVKTWNRSFSIYGSLIYIDCRQKLFLLEHDTDRRFFIVTYLRKQKRVIFYECERSCFFHLTKKLLRNSMQTTDFTLLCMLNDCL